jgi:hypothetical protein
MPGISLEPSRSLLENFTFAELLRLVSIARVRETPPRSRAQLISFITRHLSLDDVVETIPNIFPRARGKAVRGKDAGLRLDRMPPLHGEATVHAYSQARPALGRVLMEHGDRCIVLSLHNAPLFLENRWPVIARRTASVPHDRLYAAFIRRGRVHPGAEAPPPRDRPFLLDSGEYQLRNSRLRLELSRSGPVSFLVTFLRRRQPGCHDEYLLEAIA